MDATTNELKTGLDLVDDDLLVAIVEEAGTNHGGDVARWPREAKLAFQELARRTENESA